MIHVDLTADGWLRRCLVHVPLVATSQARALVLFLHGAGGNADWAATETGWPALADQEGFLAAFPEALPPNPHKPARFLSNPPVWSDDSPRSSRRQPPIDDVAFIQRLLDHLQTEFPVDAQRICLSGFSNGAAMTFRLAAELSGRFAAVGPVAGHCWVRDPRPTRPMPTLYLIGTEDPLVPLEGGMIRSPWRWTETRPPVSESLTRWARALGCSPAPWLLSDENGVEKIVYDPGPAAAELQAWFISGLGHHWPGGKGQMNPRLAGRPSNRVDGCAVLWEFFRKHRSV